MDHSDNKSDNNIQIYVKQHTDKSDVIAGITTINKPEMQLHRYAYT